MTVPQPAHTFCPSSSTTCGAGQLGFGHDDALGKVAGLGGTGTGTGAGVDEGRRMDVDDGLGLLLVANRGTARMPGLAIGVAFGVGVIDDIL